jgi:hypothetical protein
MRAPPLAALTLLLAACRPARDDTPEAAYRSFAAAANKGDAERAFALLSPDSQARVRARLAGLGAASGGSLGEDAARWMFSGGRAPPLTAVQLLKKDPDRATLGVTAGERTREVTLVRQGSVWRVQLPRGSAPGPE